MAWLQYSGKNPSEFDYTIHGGGGISSDLLKRRRTWQDDLADIVKTVAPQIKDYLQSRKSDQIANQLMNMEQPPRAQAVDQSGATFDPALAARQGLNATSDPAATSPFTGGAQGMKLQNAYQAYLDKQQEDQTKAAQEEQNSRWKEAQITHINAPQEGRYPVTLPDGNTVMVTGNEAAQYYKPRANQNVDSIEKIDKDAQAWTGHHLHELINSTDARNNPDGSAVITLADGKTKATLTADALNSIRGRYARLQNGQGVQTNPGMTAFENARQQAQTTLPSPDLPPVTEPDSTPAVASKADYDALPSGTVYLAPDGTRRKKP